MALVTKEKKKNHIERLANLVVYLVAGAAALAVFEQGLVAARGHGRERVLVHVLEPTRTTCTHHIRSISAYTILFTQIKQQSSVRINKGPGGAMDRCTGGAHVCIET